MAEELKRLQGVWRRVAWEKDGDTEPFEEQGWEPRIAITGNSFVVTLADGSTAIKGTFKLDPTRQPKLSTGWILLARTPARYFRPSILWRTTA